MPAVSKHRLIVVNRLISRRFGGLGLPAAIIVGGSLFLFYGCLAAPRTDAELNAAVAAGEGSKRCQPDDVKLLKAGVTDQLVKCITRPDGPACDDASACTTRCMGNLQMSTSCRVCINLKVGPCIVKNCAGACEMNDPGAGCGQDCGKECEDCIVNNCEKLADTCAPPPPTGG